MTYSPEIHHRKSIRLKGVGYAGMGAYFMTVCTHQRALLFENPMYRAIVEEEWRKTETVRSSVRLDEFVCMPNHLHGIIWFVDPVGAGRWLAPAVPADPGASHRPAPTNAGKGSLGSIIGQFKSIVTKRINRLHHETVIPVWQRNYYERVIRDDVELDRIREYIRNNPATWETDEENPQRRRTETTGDPAGPPPGRGKAPS